jgi:hypothetical protein
VRIAFREQQRERPGTNRQSNFWENPSEEDKHNESQTIGKADLRKMQSHSPQRQCYGHLRKSETQTKTRLGGV